MPLTLTGKTPEQLNDALNKVQERINELEAQEQVLQADLDGYGTEGYKYFKDNVLPKELRRLDEERRTKISPTEQWAQCTINGQQQEVMRLMKAEETLNTALHLCLVQLLGAKRERDTLRGKLEKGLKHDAK